MHTVGTAERDRPAALLTVENEDAAIRCPARLLISAATQEAVETLARRIHRGGPRAQFPFIQKSAGEFPLGREALSEYCLRLLDAAAGGTVFVSAVEETPAIVLDAFIELLAGLEAARAPSAAVRLISGTTVSLHDRVAEGTFSERLFYRLNIIHLMASGDPSVVAPRPDNGQRRTLSGVIPD